MAAERVEASQDDGAAKRSGADLLTVEEAAAALHATVTVACIRAAIRNGRLPAARIGRRYYVTRDALRRFARCPSPANPQDSTSVPTAANGSSATATRPYGQALAETAAAALLKTPCGTTSVVARRSGAGLRAPTS
jgi:excisionase family DNA binding protein